MAWRSRRVPPAPSGCRTGTDDRAEPAPSDPLPSDPDGALAAIVALEQADQRLGCALQAIEDVELGLDPALGDPARQPRLGLGAAVIKVHDDEPVHSQS